MSYEPKKVTFLVIGGGIAGVTCAETLATYSNESILLVTESTVIKTVTNLEPVARYLHKFNVQERTVGIGEGLAPTITIIVDQIQHIMSKEKYVRTKGNLCIQYEYLCICTGGIPRLIAKQDPRVIGIRDTDSVFELQRRLQKSKRIVLVGNGGIASELAYALTGVEVHWIVKDNHIASTFVDPGAAHFFQRNSTKTSEIGVIKRLRYAEEVLANFGEVKSDESGAALGPDWHLSFQLQGNVKSEELGLPKIYYKAHVQHIGDTINGLVPVTLSTGECITCDFIVSATGVKPRHEFDIDESLAISEDNGILVDAMMATNIPRIFAAGDVCTAGWTNAPHWFQMRLWTQARQMGAMAGRSMVAALNNEVIYQDFCFELFGHVTKLFGYEVVLLGRYNGQGLGTDYEILLRSTPGKEYIKFVLQNGRLRGAILIGDITLAETCENLILNEIDLTPFGDEILNPDIDIEDYFD